MPVGCIVLYQRNVLYPAYHAPISRFWGPHALTDIELTSAQIGGARYSQSFALPPAGGRPPRERANPRANVGRLQATPSDARRLSSLVKCPLSDTEPRPATLET